MSEVKNDRVEEILTQIQMKLETEAKTSEIIAKSADDLLTVQTQKYNDLVKAVENIGSTLDNLTDKLNVLATAFASLNIPTATEIEKTIAHKAEEISKNVNDKIETIEKSIVSENEELAKKVEILEKQPVIKSVIELEETVAKSVVAVETPKDFINKALNEMQTTKDDNKRRQLFKAITLLESGASLNQVKELIK
jgi:hypothetical protein